MKTANLFRNILMFAGVASMLVNGSSSAFAFGAKAPDPAAQASQIKNKSQYLENAVNEFNSKYADVTIGSTRTNKDFSDEEMYSLAIPYYNAAVQELCSKLSPVIPTGSSCKDLIQANIRTSQKNDSSYKTPTGEFIGFCALTFGVGCILDGGSSYNYNYNHVYSPHAQFSVALTNKAASLAKSPFFNDPTNKSIEYNVMAIQTALNNLQLLPAQKKTLDGFWNAASAFTSAINTEKAKQARGETFLPITHRNFVNQANLLVAYHRYLKNDLAELAQFGSVEGGVSQNNKAAVEVIANSIRNLTEAYGLDADVASKQVAAYGRVVLDLLSNFSIQLTLNEKQTLQPIMLQIVSQVIPMSEAYGDAGAHDAVERLKDLWESDAFNALLTDKLSISDEKSTALILNMSAAIYKLGLSANVDIRTFDARDAERIKLRKLN
ncbi:MAG: hypothetical protein ACJ763_07060 [Bdellovibrionia bacterium]